MNTYLVTGKKPRDGVAVCSWDTITEQIKAHNFMDAYTRFKKLYPDHTMVGAPRLIAFSRMGRR